MVSYYNPLSPAMFPNPPQMGVARHTTTPSAASAASVAAGHAYFQANYHAHVAAAAYGAHSHPAAHQYPGGYSAANLAADLNSNMYNGAGQNGQFMADNNWSSAASQWPAFGHPPISSSTSAAGSTACRFENWPQQQQQQQQQNNNEDSPPTPNNNDTAGLPAASGGRSPGNNYAQSHSSGSPSATPTPAGVSSATAQSYQPDMFNNKFTPNFGGHSPNGPMQNLESSSPLNSHMGSGELNPMASPVSLASPSSRPQPARSPYEWMKKPSYQSQPEKQGRTRTKDKYRVVYSDHQRLELEKEFHYSRYITIRRKAELANSVGLSERQVKIWFQNRRAKERRALKKTEEAIVKDKLDPTTSATMAAAAAHAAAAANFVPFHSDSFHPPPSSLEFGSPPPPQPPTFHHHHHHGTTPMKFE